jgi:glycosyltransferase involved in cell wall biosynthesis
VGAAVTRPQSKREIGAVGIVLPVHDEEERLPAALEAIEAAAQALPHGIASRAVVVLDHCRDGSTAIARAWGGRTGALVIKRECRSVGAARRAGSRALLSCWPAMHAGEIWMATTDADSRVPTNWLTVQLQAHVSGADLWAGRVRVVEESATVHRWRELYEAEGDPVHGANMGFTATLYRGIGGFGRLRSGEDRDLHRRAVAAGFMIAHDRKAAVTTSSRRRGRAPGGFAGVLGGVERERLEATA